MYFCLCQMSFSLTEEAPSFHVKERLLQPEAAILCVERKCGMSQSCFMNADLKIFRSVQNPQKYLASFCSLQKMSPATASKAIHLSAPCHCTLVIEPQASSLIALVLYKIHEIASDASNVWCKVIVYRSRYCERALHTRCIKQLTFLLQLRTPTSIH